MPAAEPGVIPNGEHSLTCAEIIALSKDLIISAAAVVGAIVAVKGLSTWQRQLKGKSEYDLSRRLLVSLFKYRDTIDGVRHPIMWAYEMPLPSKEEADKMSKDLIRFYGTSKAYQERWDKVQKERTSIYADLLESEALWGNDLKNLFKVLFDLQHELLINVRHYLELIDPDVSQAKKEAVERIQQKKRDIMYDDLSDEEDEYKKEFKKGIDDIEKYLKPKLTH
ncbi:MAG: hypothetical protein OQL11_06355 [Gammaproteobacteria bacterium]|nr:hypothetical protein [Gammaproteobacteria bacterium]